MFTSLDGIHSLARYIEMDGQFGLAPIALCA